MKIKDAQQVIREAISWFPADSTGRLILKSFALDEYNGEAFAPPVPFSKFTDLDEWTLSEDNAGVSARIRHIQESMDTREFPFRSSVYLTHEKGYCFLIIGTEQVGVIRERRERGGLPNVTLSFEGKDGMDNLPRFGKGDLVKITASSPVRGWLYLFSVDANRVITPVYPGEGKASDIILSQNTRINITDKVNEAINKKAEHQQPRPLCYCGSSQGMERVIALVVKGEDPVPVTISHLRSRFPLPFLFAHEQKHKGMGYSPTDSDNDFTALSLERIAIGTLDYFYEG